MAVGYRVGSPQAAAAYDRWLEQQADEDEDDQGWRG